MSRRSTTSSTLTKERTRSTLQGASFILLLLSSSKSGWQQTTNYKHQQTSLAWHPSKPLLAIGNSQGELEIWSVFLSTSPNAQSESDDGSGSEEYTSENRRLCTATKNNSGAVTMVRFNSSGEYVSLLSSCNPSFLHNAFLGSMILSGSDDGTCRVYSLSADATSLTLDLEVAIAYGQILSACWHPNDGY